MDARQQTDNEQITLWNGPAGHAWVEAQGLLDHLFKPFEDLIIERISAAPTGEVLDVGCGTGSTTLAVARLLGANGRCTGIDVSDPMIVAARDRAQRERTPASFIRANAQIHRFEPGSFDVIISRFGVMFFDDPVKAFANLRSAAREDARLVIIAWRSAADNPFMTTAERAAAPLLPELPARQPDAPGQFAFGDARRVHSILKEGGWAEIDIRPIDVACTLPEKQLIPYLTRVGPVGRTLEHADEQTRAHVIETVRAAFDLYVHGSEVRFTSACWIVCARASTAPAHG
jgi:SAM-dependent methyltransferase